MQYVPLQTHTCEHIETNSIFVDTINIHSQFIVEGIQGNLIN